MAAEITRTATVARRYHAWCDQCQDGYQGGKVTVIRWAEKHNAERHGETQWLGRS